MKKLLKILLTITILVGSSIPANAAYMEYTSMNVPTWFNSSFKTYMDYRAVTNTRSAQYKFLHTWTYTDNEGFLRSHGERDLGITDDYYVVALGSYYGTEIGSRYRITTDMGKVFYAILGDCKADRHTNSTHQYAVRNKDIVEFVVDTRKLNKLVKRMGTANVYMPLNGSITKIEKIIYHP